MKTTNDKTPIAVTNSQLIAIGILFVLLLVTNVALAVNPIYISTTNGGTLVIDLDNEVERRVFREEFAEDPAVAKCFERADWGVHIMQERDAGTTQVEHLELLEALYEKTKLEPEGVIPWHAYIDYERTVRDVHRSAGSSGKGQYFYTDPNDVWSREFKWCSVG